MAWASPRRGNKMITPGIGDACATLSQASATNVFLSADTTTRRRAAARKHGKGNLSTGLDPKLVPVDFLGPMAPAMERHGKRDGLGLFRGVVGFDFQRAGLVADHQRRHAGDALWRGDAELADAGAGVGGGLAALHAGGMGTEEGWAIGLRESGRACEPHSARLCVPG